MRNIKLFEKWIRQALKDSLFFKTYTEFCIVTDGYTAYRIRENKGAKGYTDIVKGYTFQNLNEDFRIRSRKIESIPTPDINKIFEVKNKKKAAMTELIYGRRERLRIFKVGDELVFIREEYLKNINSNEYEAYGTDPACPIIFESEQIDYLVLPTRVGGFPYKIENKLREEEQWKI